MAHARKAKLSARSQRTESVIALFQVMAGAWLMAFLIAIGFIVVYGGTAHETAEMIAGIAMFIAMWTAAIFLLTLMLLSGLVRRSTWAWFAGVLYLLLHLMGLLAPFALFGLSQIFKLEFQADFGLARSPRDLLPDQ